MGEIKELRARSPELVERLLAIWESSVRATHTFLQESDIAALRPEVAAGLREIPQLYGWLDEHGTLQGFVGAEGDKIEMLFVDAATRGRGAGKQLLLYATGRLGAKYVDVNEQNVQGAGFYSHMGFAVVGRDERDGQGRPFPILHLCLGEM